MLSTGFDIDKVVEKAMPRLGWNNSTKAPSNVVSDANQVATSGRKFNDNSFHASCTLESLWYCQDNEAITAEQFNALLTVLKKSVIISSLNAVFSDVQFIESGLAFDFPHKYSVNKIANTGKFCAIRIKVGKGNFAVQVPSVHLLFDADATFNLYLYQDLKKAPNKEIEVTVKADEVELVDVSEVFNYISAKGGSYHLGYFQDDLNGAKAIDISPCWNTYKVFSFESIIAAVVPAVGDGSRDFDRLNYECSTQMRGMNLELVSTRDYTDDIIKGLHQLDELIGLSMAAKVIEIILNSGRSNKVERIGKENLTMLYTELNAITTEERPYSPGLKSKISKEVKRLQKVFSQKAKSQIVDQ